MRSNTIALFGEAEKGEFQVPYFFQTLPQLVDSLGNPPKDSRGLYCAIQTLLFQQNLIFLRVKEEGFSVEDYLKGVKILEASDWISKIAAIYMPGVGEPRILDEFMPLCRVHHPILIMDEADFYDYLVSV